MIALLKKYLFAAIVSGLDVALKYALKTPVFFLIVTLLVVYVQTVEAVQLIDPVYAGFKQSIDTVSTRLQNAAYHLFFVLATLQFIVTMYGELTKGGGEIEVVITKLVKSIVWLSFCFWLMSDSNASNFIRNTAQYFLNNAIGFASASGSAVPMDVAGVIKAGLDGIQAMYGFFGALLKNEINIFSWSGGFNGAIFHEILFVGAAFLISLAVILGITAYLALKVLMLKIEVLLITMLLPLNLAFLGLNAMRDQGFAPFKHMIAIIFRILILGVVLGGMSSMAINLEKYIAVGGVDSGNVIRIITLILGMMIGYMMLGYLAYKSDTIASSLASGSSNLGSQSDSAIGAALGMAAAVGAASALKAAGGASASMGKSGVTSVADMMKSAGISNASTRGTGKSPSPPPPPPVSASVGGGTKGEPPKADAGKASGPDSSSPKANNSSGAAGPSSGGASNTADSGSQGSGADAGIEAPMTNSSSMNKDIKNPDAPPAEKDGEKKKSLMDHVKDKAGRANENIAQQDASTSISLNVHHDD